MTISEIEDSLPNGFHDAGLIDIQVDFVRKTAVFSVLVDVSGDGMRDRELRGARLLLKGLHTILFEHEISVPSVSDRPLTISSFEPTAKQLSAFDSLPPQAKANLVGFYVLEWNGFIFISADDAILLWSDPSEGNDQADA